MTRDMGQYMLPAVKTENFLLPPYVANFSDFYLAVRASINDANHQKLNSFITPMTRDIGQNMQPAVKTENFLLPIFLILSGCKRIRKRCKPLKTEFIYHTHDPRYGPKYAASSKNGKLFVADFSDFYVAVSASVNDANHRKPSSSITSVTRDKGQNMLSAVKTENFLSPIVFIFIWLQAHP